MWIRRRRSWFNCAKTTHMTHTRIWFWSPQCPCVSSICDYDVASCLTCFAWLTLRLWALAWLKPNHVLRAKSKSRHISLLCRNSCCWTFAVWMSLQYNSTTKPHRNQHFCTISIHLLCRRFLVLGFHVDNVKFHSLTSHIYTRSKWCAKVIEWTSSAVQGIPRTIQMRVVRFLFNCNMQTTEPIRLFCALCVWVCVMLMKQYNKKMGGIPCGWIWIVHLRAML